MVLHGEVGILQIFARLKNHFSILEFRRCALYCWQLTIFQVQQALLYSFISPLSLTYCSQGGVRRFAWAGQLELQRYQCIEQQPCPHS